MYQTTLDVNMGQSKQRTFSSKMSIFSILTTPSRQPVR